VIGLADLTVGLLGRDLSPGLSHLDSDHDATNDRRGDDYVDRDTQNGVNDRADDQERDQYADPDGGDLEPAHPPLPLSDEFCP
jgi:hypothetical protein